jgi:putative hydrolase of the HAD superfamily
MPAMTTTGITTVTLDVGNTLLYCDPSPPEIYAEAFGRHGRPVPAEEVAPVFRDSWAEMQRRTPPGTDRYSSVRGGERAWWGQLLQLVLERLEHDAAREPLLDDLYAAFSQPEIWRLFPEVWEALETLAGQGLRMAVISNWDSRLPEILDGLDLTRWFETVSVSVLEQVEKPSIAIFRRTLQRLGVTAGEAVHVGDSPREDYEGAARAGLHPVLIDRKGLFAETSYRRVAGLDELPAVIATLSESVERYPREAECATR